MFKKLILGTAVFLFFVFSSFYFLLREKPEEKTLGIKQEIESKKVNGFGDVYNFDYIITDSERVFLYFNYEKLSGSAIKDKYGCNYLVSGGFYDSNFKPIGLLISQGKEISPWQENRLFNAVFSINLLDIARITQEVPKDPLRVALQSGPLIFENGGKIALRSSAVFERRVVLGITGENRPVFLVFWSQNNFLKGPMLEELPFLIEEINEIFGLNIADAMNLDGGTASFFYGDSLVLGEVSTVGSFFCIFK